MCIKLATLIRMKVNHDTKVVNINTRHYKAAEILLRIIKSKLPEFQGF